MPVPAFKTRKLGILADILRALVNPQIRYGDSNQVLISDANFVIQIKRSGGSGSGSTKTKMTLVSHEGDYLVCTDADNNTVNVAKPYELRFSTTSEEIDGITFAYSSYSTANQTRTATWTEDGDELTEDQIIVPRYKAGAVIWAESVASTGVTVSGTELTYVESNDGHAWARVYADRIVTGTVNLGAGDNSGSVTGLGLLSTPKQVFFQVEGAFIIATTTGAPTTDGFGYELSGGAPSGGKLHWMLVL